MSGEQSSGITGGIVTAGAIIGGLAGIGLAIGNLLDWGLTWLTGGSTDTGAQALKDFLNIFKAGVALAFLVQLARYAGVLGAGGKPAGSPERQAYEDLRAKLAEGATPLRIYERSLGTFLDWTERFFGDAGTKGQRAFGLRTPAPLWTAPALDRCLLLALIYPIVTIFLIWAISDNVGPAEAALGFQRDFPAWRKVLAVAAIGISARMAPQASAPSKFL
jgi:hypothetical protein